MPTISNNAAILFLIGFTAHGCGASDGTLAIENNETADSGNAVVLCERTPENKWLCRTKSGRYPKTFVSSTANQLRFSADEESRLCELVASRGSQNSEELANAAQYANEQIPELPKVKFVENQACCFVHAMFYNCMSIDMLSGKYRLRFDGATGSVISMEISEIGNSHVADVMRCSVRMISFVQSNVFSRDSLDIVFRARSFSSDCSSDEAESDSQGQGDACVFDRVVQP